LHEPALKRRFVREREEARGKNKRTRLKRAAPTPVFSAKSAQVIEKIEVTVLPGAKECVRV
jgi:hypothetical protein